MRLYDHDSLSDNDPIDIGPSGTFALDFTYNLQTQAMSISSPRTGNAGKNATIYFNMFSEALAYDFDVISNASQVANGWLYTNDFRNLSTSHYNIGDVALPGYGRLSLELLPGESFQLSRLSPYRPGTTNATARFGDLDRTEVSQTVAAPIPLPAPVLLLAGSLAGLAYAGRPRRRR